ncbi:pinin [Zeugodacus cucurbitae]|uniref:Pinin n=1 Tax=Zeugodacus cucurbitae TaxID=28588 RepID=A0A0A1WEI6_ZEUCU|nr:pinin [Zeugodacus cucurbitae]
MDSDISNCCQVLQQELEDAKCHLDVLNNNIRKIVGRPRDLGNDKNVEDNSKDECSQKYATERKSRRTQEVKSVFNRLSISNDDLRPRLSSRVIKELPTRQDVLKAQESDLESRARNRRMFGSLLGTLHKFCQEESRLKLKEDKKAQVEKKLEQQQLLEREALRKERDCLLLNRQKKQEKITAIELKLNRLKDFTAFENTSKNCRGCIKTKTKPSLFYRPYKFSKKTQFLLNNSRQSMESEMRSRKIMLNSELKEFDFENDTEDNNDKGTASNQNTINIINKPCLVQGELEFKENKSRNSNEPTLISSIIVVKNNK